MFSKSRMLEAVKGFDSEHAQRGLAETPSLATHRDKRGRNWLHVCCSVDVRDKPAIKRSKSIELAKLLLAHGFDIDAAAFTEGTWKATPLWYAIAWGRNLELATFLLKRGADPNHCMHAAAFNDDVAAVKLLARHGAPIDTGKDTPFIFAVQWSRFDAAEALLKLGANVNARSVKGTTALHLMLKKGTDKKYLQMLMRHGARGDIEDPQGKTAVDIMMRKKDADIRRMAERLQARATHSM